MRARKWTTFTTAYWLAVFASGCAHNSAPHGWLSRPETAQSEAFGSWLEIGGKSEGRALHYEGEFIAVQADSVFVLSADGLDAIPKASIVRARLTAYDARAGDLAGWTFLGTVGTLSHGIALIISAPVWILFGSVATSAQSHSPMVKIPPDPWREAAKFARFPQGLPDDLDRASLAQKR